MAKFKALTKHIGWTESGGFITKSEMESKCVAEGLCSCSTNSTKGMNTMRHTLSATQVAAAVKTAMAQAVAPVLQQLKTLNNEARTLRKVAAVAEPAARSLVNAESQDGLAGVNARGLDKGVVMRQRAGGFICLSLIEDEGLDMGRLRQYMRNQLPPSWSYQQFQETIIKRLADRRREAVKLGSTESGDFVILKENSATPIVKDGHYVVLDSDGKYWAVPDAAGGWSRKVESPIFATDPTRRFTLEPVEPDVAEAFAVKAGIPMKSEASESGTADPEIVTDKEIPAAQAITETGKAMSNRRRSAKKDRALRMLSAGVPLGRIRQFLNTGR